MINSGIENYFCGFKTKLEKEKAWHVVYVFVILQLTNGDVCVLITFDFQPIVKEKEREKKSKQEKKLILY